ncbi:MULTISPECIES: extracellular solute-binding protein [unclassified Halomonas]|uniref:extracellular solute-binding protein n=1 Tax=unclassified Halomonas TaxID=2609666 RepID=UPI00209F3F0C|nr:MULTISPECIES: extracellular solute-binding protein [unclassified Halomonas]MCP1315921.1 extracellular solute-binding protein [Halomonas sp. 707D7]MCP1328021.1 extracellular solute-binding protein [Halomonas sp. 707D4]
MKIRRTHKLALAVGLALAAGQASATTLNVFTAGDDNMVAYVNEFLAPRFEANHPDVTVRALGTGPGDAGSQAIYEMLSAQRDKQSWGVDVAVLHQRMAGQMVEEGLLRRYTDTLDTAGLATGESARNALGVDVEGYVMPMFQSQIALAYNPALLETPPQSYAVLDEWAKEHPGKFGYNGITGGMAGVGFVFGWMYAFSDMADTLQNGPWSEESVAGLDDALARLRDFNENVTLTPGNAGTMDAMNRGEIAMGPVWMDMYTTWKADGRLNPDFRLLLPEPGMPGQPMYYAIPERAEHAELAAEFIALATSPKVQAEGIVGEFNWFPGIDAEHVQDELSEAQWDALYSDVSPQTLSERGLSMPQADYFRAILEAYESQVSR